MTRKRISEVIGAAQTGEPVYRALRRLLCRDCGEAIAEGDNFTRWPLAEGGLRILPRCRRCVPFELSEGGGRKRSELLESLVSTPHAASPPPTTPRKQKIDEEINRRLGPALARRTRRPR